MSIIGLKCNEIIFKMMHDDGKDVHEQFMQVLKKILHWQHPIRIRQYNNHRVYIVDIIITDTQGIISDDVGIK